MLSFSFRCNFDCEKGAQFQESLGMLVVHCSRPPTTGSVAFRGSSHDEKYIIITHIFNCYRRGTSRPRTVHEISDTTNVMWQLEIVGYTFGVFWQVTAHMFKLFKSPVLRVNYNVLYYFNFIITNTLLVHSIYFPLHLLVCFRIFAVNSLKLFQKVIAF